MSPKNKKTKYKCTFCDEINFDIPKDIIEAIKKEELVIFAGAGISTEGKNVYKSSLYSDINDELGENNDNSFPELMTKYCNLPNGRRKLINKIMERFDYYKAFSEIDNVMRRFFDPLADIYGIKDIITTNWDRQFEEKCGCIPIVYDSDIAVLDESKRKVYKIHGTIENIGTLVMTVEDYKKCYKDLKNNLLGSRIKNLLSNKTVVFIGYSMEDEDFKKIWEFIDNSLGNLKPHFYIVSPDEKLKVKLKDKNVTVINTIGSNFIEKIRKQLIEEGFILNSDIIYPMVYATLDIALKEHKRANERYHKEKNPLLIYSILYQDGIIHSLKRIISRQEIGEYMDPDFISNSIESYYYLFDKYMKENRIFDAPYIMGYAHAMEFILNSYIRIWKECQSSMKETISLYYLPRKNLYNDIERFNNALKEYNLKKYKKLANEICNKFGGIDTGLEIHHLPFI